MTGRDKRQVAQHFSRAAQSYDRAASIQQRAVTALLHKLPALSGHWLDIGCGTGVALPHLRLKGANRVTGIDLAEGMLEAAASHADPQTDLLLADADDLPLPDCSADGVISSLMLQWSEAPEETLKEWRRVMKPGSRIAIATLLPGTQRELQQAWGAIDDRPHVNEFEAPERLNHALTQAGFTDIVFEQDCLTEYYDSVPDLLRSLKAIGATNVNAGRRAGLGGRAAIEALSRHYPTTLHMGQTAYPLSYEVLWIYALVHPEHPTEPKQ